MSRSGIRTVDVRYADLVMVAGLRPGSSARGAAGGTMDASDAAGVTR